MMFKKPSRNRDASDITADNPAKAMDQLTEGLRRARRLEAIQAP
jgi:hypothetical protein